MGACRVGTEVDKPRLELKWSHKKIAAAPGWRQRLTRHQADSLGEVPVLEADRALVLFHRVYAANDRPGAFVAGHDVAISPVGRHVALDAFDVAEQHARRRCRVLRFVQRKLMPPLAHCSFSTSNFHEIYC